MKYKQMIQDLKQRMVAEGKTQHQFAKQFKITQSYLSEILAGRRKPGEVVLKRFGYEIQYVKVEK